MDIYNVVEDKLNLKLINAVEVCFWSTERLQAENEAHTLSRNPSSLSILLEKNNRLRGQGSKLMFLAKYWFLRHKSKEDTLSTQHMHGDRQMDSAKSGGCTTAVPVDSPLRTRGVWSRILTSVCTRSSANYNEHPATKENLFHITISPRWL